MISMMDKHYPAFTRKFMKDWHGWRSLSEHCMLKLADL